MKCVIVIRRQGVQITLPCIPTVCTYLPSLGVRAPFMAANRLSFKARDSAHASCC